VIEPSAPLASDQADAKSESETKAATKASAAAKEAKAAEDRARERDAEQAKAREAQLAAAAEAKAKRDAAESARAQSLLESKKPAGTERLVVQVGAFSDPASARATRLKVERAGMTTYTHVADTPSGKLIRVRVGPFGSRAEADKAAARVKALGLPARILTL
jgi:DedD protein